MSAGWGALIGAAGGLAGGGVSMLGASRKKRALNNAEKAYYDALSRHLDQEHGVAQLEQGDYRQLAAGHNANLGSLIDNFTTAAPVSDGFPAQLNSTVTQARDAVPVMKQSWAFQGQPATDTTNRQDALTTDRRVRLADTMGAEHSLQSQQDQQGLALTGFERGEMPLDAHASQLAQYYGLGRASRGYDWTKRKNALALALKQAGTTGDQQMMWGSLIGSIGGGAGAYAGSQGNGSGGGSDSSSGDSAPANRQGDGSIPYYG